MLGILMEHIEIKSSLDSKLQTFYICSIRILNILEVIAKTSFSKSAECLTLAQGGHSNNEINVTYPKSDDVPRQKHGINRNTLSEKEQLEMLKWMMTRQLSNRLR